MVVLLTVISLSNSISKHNFFVRCYYCCSALVPEANYALVITEKQDLGAGHTTVEMMAMVMSHFCSHTTNY